MLDFPDAPVIGEIFPASGSPSFRWDGIKWIGASVGPSLVPSDTPPAMDGAATPGASGAYQRGDHVHPSDTTRLPVANANITGGMYSDSIVANAVNGNNVIYANNRIIAQNADVGGQPSFSCYSWDRGYSGGFFLDTSNTLAFGNFYGHGDPASNGSRIDIYGNLYLGHTMLVSRDPTGGLDVSTKQYVDTRTFSGAYMPMTGGYMTGQFYTYVSTGSLCGAGPPTMEVQSPGAGDDNYFTFHRTGHFATNFGCGGDWNHYMGGWSHAGVAYKFWTSRDFGGFPVSDGRMAYCGDFAHMMYTGMQEPHGGAGITGTSGYQVGTYFYMRYRAKQILTNGWYTIGYA